MIDERMEEQASLYVLGALTSEEQAAFETTLGRDAELQQLVETLRLSRDALAGSVPQLNPPPALKQKILAQIESRKKVVPLPSHQPAPAARMTWVPWALAAGLAVLCTISLLEQNALKRKLEDQTSQMATLNQMADSLRNEAQDLHASLAKLNETNRLENVRIALLASKLTNSPNTVAVSLWDGRQQNGVLLVQNLKPLPADRDYQLWVIDPKYPAPVSAGVFHVDAQGNGRTQFTPDKPIETAGNFAVTEEPKGGSPTPTLQNMVLFGG